MLTIQKTEKKIPFYSYTFIIHICLQFYSIYNKINLQIKKQTWSNKINMTQSLYISVNFYIDFTVTKKDLNFSIECILCTYPRTKTKIHDRIRTRNKTRFIPSFMTYFYYLYPVTPHAPIFSLFWCLFFTFYCIPKCTFVYM